MLKTVVSLSVLSEYYTLILTLILILLLLNIYRQSISLLVEEHCLLVENPDYIIASPAVIIS